MLVEENQKTDGDSSDSVEYPSDDETSSYERRVLKLKRRRVRAFFSEFKDDEVVKASDLLPKLSSPPSSPVRRRTHHKKRFSTPLVSFQPRKSTRLSTRSQLKMPTPPPSPVKMPRRKMRHKKRFESPLVTFQPYESTTLSTNSQLKMPTPPSPVKMPRRGRPPKKRFETPLVTFQPHESTRLSAEFQLKMPSPPPSPVRWSRSGRPYKLRFATPQPRRSIRLSTKSVDYEGLDDDFEEPRANRRTSVGGRRYRTPRIRMQQRIVEFNPDALPGKVCYGSLKVYSQSGTTCHQCRQKTIDLKSRCYSSYCRGGRGMFCGYCLLQRYGEDVAVVLRDPNWKCPPCRKVCNCSICRRSHGKEPTGQLYTSVTERGYNNVLEYLSKIGDDKLEDFEADDESEEGEEKEDVENKPPAKRIKKTSPISENVNQPILKLKRLDLSFDEEGNLLTSFKGF